MTETKREVALEQAAVALLAEAEKAGLDLNKLAESAKVGIGGNAIYTWISDSDLKTEARNAVDYLVTSTRENQAK